MFQLIVLCALLGASYAYPTIKIVNGTDAAPGEIPYIVSLRNNLRHTCGGSIVNEYIVLTASHCVVGGNPASYTIQYGVLKISQDYTNSIQVLTITTHESYTPGNGYINDVAVLRLETPIPFSDTVRPVILPSQNQETPGWSKAVLAGWGLPYTGGSVMEYLQRVDIYIYPDEACEAAHNGLARRQYHVCGGIPEGGKGQCNGDSGGPLTVEGVVFGVVSWSVKPCTVQGYPGVFARVPSYVDWINERSQIAHLV